ncbi:Chromatin structure remodeling complex protein sfh1 [Blastocladiella emersonii ATCC 22665]|nr:Chromatin structure remodeling complex protein sfh1 [Blastocladiella emersonii ATCC 22665]
MASAHQHQYQQPLAAAPAMHPHPQQQQGYTYSMNPPSAPATRPNAAAAAGAPPLGAGAGPYYAAAASAAPAIANGNVSYQTRPPSTAPNAGPMPSGYANANGVAWQQQHAMYAQQPNGGGSAPMRGGYAMPPPPAVGYTPPPPQLPRARASAYGLESDFHNRVRAFPNALLLPSTATKEEDLDLDEVSEMDLDDEPASVPTRRRNAARGQAAAAAAAASSSASATPDPSKTPAGGARGLLPVLDATHVTGKRLVYRTNHLYYYSFSPEQRAEAAALPENLIPIKLELDLDGFKLRDAFLWNHRECLVTPEKFAEILCTDLMLPHKFAPLVAIAIKAQVEEFVESGADWTAAVEMEEPLVIELDFVVGRTLIRDRFEWDLRGDLTPESFARVTCAELGLGGEYVPLYATAIRDQIVKQVRDRLTGAAGTGFFATGRSSTKLPPRDVLTGGALRFGREVDDWAPSLESLDAAEMEKLLNRDERETRRARRETSRSNAQTRAKQNEVMAVINSTKQFEVALLQQFALGDGSAPASSAAFTSAAVAAQQAAVSAAAATAAAAAAAASASTVGVANARPRRTGSSASVAPANAPQQHMVNGTAAGAPGLMRPQFVNPQLTGSPAPGSGAATPGGGYPAAALDPTSYPAAAAPPTSRSAYREPQVARYATELPPAIDLKNANVRGLAAMADSLHMWHCTHCGLDGTRTLSIRRGPQGPRTLCNACGIRYSADGALPIQRRDRFKALYGMPLSGK